MIKILSYNIHKGFTTTQQKFSLPDLKTHLHALAPDIVLLQEVIGKNKKHAKRLPMWPNSSQFEYLAEDYHHAYGKNAVYNDGDHGNAVLSRYPILFQKNIDISVSAFERRGLLHTILNRANQPIHVLCTHLNLGEGSRQKQILHIVRYIEREIPRSDAVILGGDFNDWRKNIHPIIHDCDGFVDAYVHAHKTHALTFPSWLPSLPLDRLYVRGFTVNNIQVLNEGPWKGFSDHLALCGDFESISVK